MIGIKESAAFSLFITLLAVGELLVYFGIVAPHFSLQNFTTEAFPVSVPGIIASLPFAIWFYLAIEGVAMVAEEVKDPARHIPKGYAYGILTLLALAFGVMILTGGIGNWKKLATIDYPLPEAIGFVLGKESGLTKLFASIGLFGLIASFHGIILTYSRQIFALARAGFLPLVLSNISSRFKTPNAALMAGGLVGIVALCSGTTDKLIILSVMGALLMYTVSMLSLFKLRKKEPELPRPMKAVLYPLFPTIALTFSVFCLLAVMYYNIQISIIFFGGLALALLFFRILKNKMSAT
jgi:ethanolamine permease